MLLPLLDGFWLPLPRSVRDARGRLGRQHTGLEDVEAFGWGPLQGSEFSVQASAEDNPCLGHHNAKEPALQASEKPPRLACALLVPPWTGQALYVTVVAL